MIGLNFATPLAFAFLPVPLLLLAFAGREAPANGGLALPASIRARLGARGDAASARSMLRPILAIFAWASLVAALSGPRLPAAVAALPASGRDIVLALDLSGSMTKRDFTLDGADVSRLDLVKHVGSELIRRREGDRIGLVVFAENALAAAPLSFDVRAVERTLQQMEIGLVGRSTAIGEGLGLALKRLVESTAPARIVVLLSDGANNAGSSEPAAVAELAQTLGIKVFTIGLGVADTTTSPEDAEAVDFAALQKVAQIGGGMAFRARTGEDLEAAARAIEAQIAGPAPAPPSIVYDELWVWPATLAFAACAALALSTRARR